MTSEKKPEAGGATRRTFVALLGAAAAVYVLKPTVAAAEAERPQSPIPTRWIGHI